jgi:glycosyltransferase involved in cell wall biosynthesis
MQVAGSPMKISIRQIRGNSGIDIWAQNLCAGIQRSGHHCSLDLKSSLFEFFPGLLFLSRPENEADIIQGNSWNGFAFKGEAPLVVTEHHVVDDPAFNPHKTIPQKIYHRWIYHCERKSLKVADAVIGVSNFTGKRLSEVYGFSDTHVIYNGIDTSVFRPAVQKKTPMNIPEDTTVIFFAGNLSNRKGGDLLPAIMKQLGERFLLLLATGKDAQRFTGRINIRNLGNLTQEQLVNTYNRCDIFLTPSRLEGFGLSVAEAMACGKPVVATDCSSLPELVVDCEGGFLCRVDDVNDFAEKIRHLAADEGMRREMGTFNRKRVEEKFTVERMTKKYLKLYRSLLS